MGKTTLAFEGAKGVFGYLLPQLFKSMASTKASTTRTKEPEVIALYRLNMNIWFLSSP